MIKPKIGKCLDCGNTQQLIAKRCQTCYWTYRAKVNSNKPKKIDKTLDLKKLGVFFASALLEQPKNCQECGCNLCVSQMINKKSIVAHILAKRPNQFPSVATHPLNKVYLCINCHTDFDNKGCEYIVQMKIYPLLFERVQQLIPHLTNQEYNRLPEYYLTLNIKDV